MAIFAKKADWGEIAPTPRQPAPSNTAANKPTYRIADAIQLMRALPVDQNPELIVSVVRATLGSLNVRLPDIIDDATRKEKAVQERINTFHAQIAERLNCTTAAVTGLLQRGLQNLRKSLAHWSES